MADARACTRCRSNSRRTFTSYVTQAVRARVRAGPYAGGAARCDSEQRAQCVCAGCINTHTTHRSCCPQMTQMVRTKYFTNSFVHPEKKTNKLVLDNWAREFAPHTLKVPFGRLILFSSRARNQCQCVRCYDRRRACVLCIMIIYYRHTTLEFNPQISQSEHVRYY